MLHTTLLGIGSLAIALCVLTVAVWQDSTAHAACVKAGTCQKGK